MRRVLRSSRWMSAVLMLSTPPLVGADWCQQAKLLPPSLNAGQNFGVSVDVSNGILVVGNYRFDGASGASCDSGSAVVFRDCGSSWVQGAVLEELLPSPPHCKLPCNPCGATACLSDPSASFGRSVATDGSTIAVSSQVGSDIFGGEVSLGLVDLFQLNGSQWVWIQRIAAPSPSSGQCTDGFGYTLDIDGDYLAVGAHATQNLRGAVYVYRRDGSGIWQPDADLVSPYTGQGWFGQDVALDGPRLVVGAPRAFLVANRPGAAYVYDRGPSGWATTATLTACENGEAYFGDSVAIDGDRLVCGAPFYGTNREGRAFPFYLDPVTGSWNHQTPLKAFVPMASGEFGTQLALSDDLLAVSSVPYPVVSATPQLQGTVYLFRDDGLAWAPEKQLLADDGMAGDHFGNAVAISTDTVATGALSVDGHGVTYVHRPLEKCFLACSTGCEGPGEYVPSLCVGGTAVVGGVVDVNLTQALGGSSVMLLASIGCSPTPLPLGFGCQLNVSFSPVLIPLGPFPLAGSGPGNGSIAFSLTLPPVSVPRPVAVQAAVIDGSPLGFSVSNGVTFTIQ